jgi:uncharacterized repeat protein (TIGR01451 family)
MKQSSMKFQKQHSRRAKRFPSQVLGFLISIVLFVGFAPVANAQTQQFPCNQDFYFIQGNPPANPILLNRINTATGSFNPTAFPGFGNASNLVFNGLAYNVRDGNLYAIGFIPAFVSTGTYDYTIYRIDPTGPTDIGTVRVTGISTAASDREARAQSADFDANGNLVVVTVSENPPNSDLGANVFRLPINPLPAGTITAAQLPTSGTERPFIADIAFNPSDNFFYGFDRDNGNSLARFQFDGTTVSNYRSRPVGGAGVEIGRPYGASFFDGDGNFYAYFNGGDGTFIRVANPESLAPISTVLSPSPGASSSNDGASCAFTPGFEKTVTPSPATAGSTVTYTYTLRNRTTIDLNGLTFTDTMDSGRTFVPGSQTITAVSGGFSGTPNFVFGAGNTTVTLNGISLDSAPTPPGTITEVVITIQVQLPTGLNGRVFNQAGLTGQIGGTGTQLQSSSDDPITLSFPDRTSLDVGAIRGIIGVAKQAGTPTQVTPGVFDVPFTVRVENVGPIRIDDVQIVEDLDTTFAASGPPAAALQVGADIGTFDNTGGGGFRATPNPPVENTNFNGGLGGGTADTNLLDTGTTLEPGDFLTVTYTVRVTPGSTPTTTTQLLLQVQTVAAMRYKTFPRMEQTLTPMVMGIQPITTRPHQ